MRLGVGVGVVGQEAKCPPTQDAPLSAAGPQLSPFASRASSPLNSLIDLPHINCMFLGLKILPKHRHCNLSACALCTQLYVQLSAHARGGQRTTSTVVFKAHLPYVVGQIPPNQLGWLANQSQGSTVSLQSTGVQAHATMPSTF